MGLSFRLTVSAAPLALQAGRAMYETTLTNAHGETLTCKAGGNNGIVTKYHLRQGFDDGSIEPTVRATSIVSQQRS